MAVPGPKPTGKPTRDRNPRVHDWTEVVNLPFSGEIPELPEREGGWPARTLRKWRAWSTQPHCGLWSEAEWDFAIDSLEVAAQFHAGDPKLATELRNRERVLGTTIDYRRDLRIRYVDPPAEAGQAAGVTSLADYRDL